MTDREFSLLSMGEVLLRLSPPGNERLMRGDVLEKQVGGAELNVVSGVSLLGLRTGIISKLPDNEIGMYAKNQIRFCGVSDDYLVYDKEKEARLGLYYYENGAFPRKPRVVYDRAGASVNRICLEDFPQDMYRSTACFHTSGITLALSPRTRETAIAMMRRFKENNTLISFDVNFRGNLWSGAEARKCIEEILPLVDIFFCSEDTARLTFGKEGTLHEMMREFAAEYPISAIASTKRTVHSPKIHSFTSVLYDAKSDAFFSEKPYENIEVVDRIGSGDAYVSGVLYGLLSSLQCLAGKADKEGAKKAFERALSIGNAASAVKNTVPGDLPSSDLREVEELIRAHRFERPQAEMDR